jgi:hypothetical protein
MKCLRAASLLSLLWLAGCSSPDPVKELRVSELEAYWAIDSTAGDTVYVAPVLRFRLENLSATAAIEATASFKRKGEEQSWGSAWQRLSVPGKRLEPGQSLSVALKSDGRYYTTGAPESVFAHADFKDAVVELFLRVGSSGWVKLGAAEVARRIGSKSLAAAPSPAP